VGADVIYKVCTGIQMVRSKSAKLECVGSNPILCSILENKIGRKNEQK
tara:strand:+ start:72 stop:215 length:144 start_codon:yes stop_codon:yes gene_type:complete